MTCLEKFKSEHPRMSVRYIVTTYCPDDKLVHMVCEETDGQPDCWKCWDRPVPDEGTTQNGPDR